MRRLPPGRTPHGGSGLGGRASFAKPSLKSVIAPCQPRQRQKLPRAQDVSWLDGPPRACFDGAWWPHTDDLGDQAADLAEAVGNAWHGHVARITYDPTIWTATSRRIRREGTPLRLGWFASPEPQELTLVLLDGRRVELLVVPPGAPSDQAEWAMSRAVETRSALHASEVLRLTRSTDDGQGRWDDEGGRQ